MSTFLTGLGLAVIILCLILAAILVGLLIGAYLSREHRMPARLHVIDQPAEIPWDDAGAMWRVPDYDRLPGDESYCIVLPNRAGIWITTQESSVPEGRRTGPRWTVTGTPPNLTVTPSINAGDGPGEGNWHGWIRDGELTP